MVETLEEIVQQREEEIKKKQRLFKVVVIILFICVVILTVGATLLIKYLKEIRQRPTTPVITIAPTPSATPPQQVSTEWQLHRDDNIKIFVKIPPEAKRYTTTDPLKLEIRFSNTLADFSTLDEKNLSDGYIFRVTPLYINARDLNSIVEIKRQSFRLWCPDTATVTSAHDTLIDTIDAKTFEAQNCIVDYKLTYIPRFGIYYEVAQISKGDVGIKQQYKSKTEELLQSFRFFPEDNLKPYNPYITYTNEILGFTFKYPDSLSVECCDIPGPPAEKTPAEKLIVIGDPTTSINKVSKNAVGLYSQMLAGKSFAEYLNAQKTLLVEDYKVVTGKLPETKESTLSIGNLEATKLQGYSWANNDLLYIELPTGPRTSNVVLIISARITDTKLFGEIVNRTLQSFEFFTLNR